MVQKVKKGLSALAEWIKSAQTYLWLTGMIFAAGVAWSQVATKAEMEAKCKELKSDFEKSVEAINEAIISKLTPIADDSKYMREKIDKQGSKLDRIDGKTEVLMKVIR